MASWLARIPAAHASHVSRLRLFPIEFSEDKEAVWLRGQDLDVDMEQELRKIPGTEVLDLLPSGLLKPRISRLARKMPESLSWCPIRESFSVSLPMGSMPGEMRQKLSISLIRTATESSATGLLTNLKCWAEFALTAPLVRLDSLGFAAADHEQVLIVGVPLPPINGIQLVNHGGVLVPCGFEWSPRVEASVLRQCLGICGDDLVLLFEDNTHQIIHAE